MKHALSAPSVAFALLAGCTGGAQPSTGAQPSADRADAAEASAPSTPDAAAAASPEPTPADPQTASPRMSASELHQLESRLRAMVQGGAMEDGFSWVLAHGLLAFGPEHRTDQDRLALDAIAERAEHGESGYRFGAATEAGLPVEPHPDLMIRTMIEAGLALDHPLHVDGSTVTVGRLVADAERRFEIPVGQAEWDRFAWSAGAFLALRRRSVCTTTTAEACGPVRAEGSTLPIEQVAEAALGRLEKEQAFLLPSFQADKPEAVVKRKQGIFGYTCGGMHLAQAALQGAKLLGTEEAARRARQQLDLLHFRWRAERRIYRETMERHRDYIPLLLVQELKFFGHYLETIAKAVDWSILPAEIGRRRFMAVAEDLERTTRELEPIYAAKDEIRRIRAQTYNDLLGDGCHAVHGLSLGRRLGFAEAG